MCPVAALFSESARRDQKIGLGADWLLPARSDPLMSAPCGDVDGTTIFFCNQWKARGAEIVREDLQGAFADGLNFRAS